jgi:2-oxoglutarate dehydrogenase E2 component (dihydrolipoamide succinyltransferase)
MALTLKVPGIGESIQEATVGVWKKAEGDFVKTDEPLVEIESEKATLEVPSPGTGLLKKILRKQGDTVAIGEALAEIDDTVKSAGADGRDEKAQGGKAQEGTSARDGKAKGAAPTPVSNGSHPVAAVDGGAVAAAPVPAAAAGAVASAALESPVRAPPSARKMMLETGLSADDVRAAGGRIQTEDVVRTLDQRKGAGGPATAVSARAEVRDEPDERVVPMTQLRKTIARRLVEAKNTAAMLTTFNEIDMSNVLALREKYQDRFTKQHGIKLGFMSFFAKAAIEGLRAFPAVNAEIRGTDIVYKDHYDIGVAVGGGKGLVVPVIRGADRMSFADLEKTIVGLGARAKDNKLQMSDLEGGTFTISNGGIYGSLMSTPILNPPQSGILGLHAIQKRAVVIDDAIVVRPMMYVALSYDHRIVDGREAVQFLVKVKECVETPERILLEV